jgi:hypothetical protein
MKTSLHNFKQELPETLIELAWRQWCALGVAGYTVSSGPRCIDPEALLLFTCAEGRREPRLFDAMLDWLAANPDAISLQRLNAMVKASDPSGAAVLGALAATLAKTAGGSKWASVVRHCPVPKPAEPLFFFKNGRPMQSFGQPDQVFEKAGFLRGKVQLPGKLTPFRVEDPACLLLRLRAFFGVSARAEVALYLLTHPDGATPSEMARETGYRQSTIHATMGMMAASGFVNGRQAGKKIIFSMTLPMSAALTAGVTPAPVWQSWPPLFLALTALRQLLASPAFAQAEPAVAGLLLRQFMETHLEALDRAGFHAAFPERGRQQGTEYRDWVVRGFQQVLATLLQH